LFGVARVVELARFFEASHNHVDEEFVVRAAREFLFHFVDRVGAAREGAEGDVVEFGFGFELGGLGEHEGKNEVRK
jgi:hypothetical protein